jgi:hypothetical protein
MLLDALLKMRYVFVSHTLAIGTCYPKESKADTAGPNTLALLSGFCATLQVVNS